MMNFYWIRNKRTVIAGQLSQWNMKTRSEDQLLGVRRPVGALNGAGLDGAIAKGRDGGGVLMSGPSRTNLRAMWSQIAADREIRQTFQSVNAGRLKSDPE